jgi:hypothetical protein
VITFEKFITQAKKIVQSLEDEVFIDSVKAESETGAQDSDIIDDHDVSLYSQFFKFFLLFIKKFLKNHCSHKSLHI